MCVSNTVFTGYEDTAHTANEADERGLWEVQTLEEQEGQGGTAAKREGMWGVHDMLPQNILISNIFHVLYRIVNGSMSFLNLRETSRNKQISCGVKLKRWSTLVLTFCSITLNVALFHGVDASLWVSWRHCLFFSYRLLLQTRGWKMHCRKEVR